MSLLLSWNKLCVVGSFRTAVQDLPPLLLSHVTGILHTGPRPQL